MLTVDRSIRAQTAIAFARSHCDSPVRPLLPWRFCIVALRLNRSSPTDRWSPAPSSPAHNLISLSLWSLPDRATRAAASRARWLVQLLRRWLWIARRVQLAPPQDCSFPKSPSPVLRASRARYLSFQCALRCLLESSECLPE